jgi:YggT family protein
MIILTVLSFISKLVSIYSIILVAYALLSWFPGAENSKVGEWIYKLVHPYLSMFEKFPLRIGMIDFTVIAALLLLQLANTGLDYLVLSFLN